MRGGRAMTAVRRWSRVRDVLHPLEWHVLQQACDQLLIRTDVGWAGVMRLSVHPTWIAFAGAADRAPLPVESDQGFREIEGLPPGLAVASTVPGRPRRTFACGIIDRVALAIVVVPGSEATSVPLEIVSAVTIALRELERVMPVAPAGPGIRLRPPHHFAALHDAEWLRLPDGKER